MNARQARRILAEGRLTPGLLPDEALLALLADEIARDGNRRIVSNIGVALLALMALPVAWLGAVVLFIQPELLWTILLFGLAFVVGVGFLILRFEPNAPGPACRAALRYIHTELLPSATPAQTPGLLHLRNALARSFPGHPEPEIPAPPGLWNALHDTLLTLLPRFHDVQRLSGDDVFALQQIALQCHQTRPPLCAAALLTLAEVGVGALRNEAWTWSRFHADERTREAAAEYLRLTERAP